MGKQSRSRSRNKNRLENTPGQPQAQRQFNPPPPITLTDTTRIRLIPGDDPAPPPPPPREDGENGPTGPRRESRANSVKRGLRSKFLFPLEMKESIDELFHAFSLQQLPRTRLEEWLVFELARSSVQCDECNDQLLINKLRVIERVGISWDDDCTERIDKLGERLHKDPYHIQRALARTRHGALYLIDKWALIDDSIVTNGGLDESQFETVHDLLGIEHVYRNGCRQVPAATDAPALRAVVAREVGRLPRAWSGP